MFFQRRDFPGSSAPPLPHPLRAPENEGAVLPPSILSKLWEVGSELPSEDQITAPPHLQGPTSPGSQPRSPGELSSPASLAPPPREAASVLELPSPSPVPSPTGFRCLGHPMCPSRTQVTRAHPRRPPTPASPSLASTRLPVSRAHPLGPKQSLSHPPRRGSDVLQDTPNVFLQGVY